MRKDICDRESFLIVGFGRMGLSHAAQLGLLREKCTIYVFDPSVKVKLLIRLLSFFTNLRYIPLRNLAAHKYFDLTVIASPPNYQSYYYNLLKDNSKKFLIEKPLVIDFKMNNPDIKNVYVGYVLQHVKTFKKIKEILETEQMYSIEIVVETNIDVAQMDGWRSENFFGSFVSEYGSHAINLLLFLSNENFEFENLELLGNGNQKLKLKNEQTEATIFLEHKSTNVRKTMYCVNVSVKDCDYSVDAYQIKRDGRTIYSVTDDKSAVKSYLRGEEFAAQAEYVLSQGNHAHELKCAVKTRKILDHAKKKLDSIG